MHGKGLLQSMSFAQDYYNCELSGKLKGIMRASAQRARAVTRTRFGVGVSNHTINQAATQRVAAVLAEFLR